MSKSVGDWVLVRLEAMFPKPQEFDNEEAYLEAYRYFVENVTPLIVRMQRSQAEHNAEKAADMSRTVWAVISHDNGGNTGRWVERLCTTEEAAEQYAGAHPYTSWTGRGLYVVEPFELYGDDTTDAMFSEEGKK